MLCNIIFYSEMLFCAMSCYVILDGIILQHLKLSKLSQINSLSLSLSPVTAPCCHKQVRGQLDKHVATAPASDISGARGGPGGNGVMELMQVCVWYVCALFCFVCVCAVCVCGVIA
jgi:hypothetical protein